MESVRLVKTKCSNVSGKTQERSTPVFLAGREQQDKEDFAKWNMLSGVFFVSLTDPSGISRAFPIRLVKQGILFLSPSIVSRSWLFSFKNSKPLFMSFKPCLISCNKPRSSLSLERTSGGKFKSRWTTILETSLSRSGMALSGLERSEI